MEGRNVSVALQRNVVTGRSPPKCGKHLHADAQQMEQCYAHFTLVRFSG